MAYTVYEPNGTQTNLVLVVGVLCGVVMFLCGFVVQGCVHSCRLEKRIQAIEAKLEQAQADSKAAYENALWTSSLLSDNMDAVGKEIRNINKQTGMRLWGWQ